MPARPPSRAPEAGARIRIGYACVNASAGCTSSSSFRLASFTPELAEGTARSNLACLRRVLEWNASHGISLFRMSSDIVPFASHPKASWPWLDSLDGEFKGIGRYARSRWMRLCMHPDQFVVLDSPKAGVVHSSVAELEYHCALMDAMGLPSSAKVQVHVGGAYGDKGTAIRRFVEAVAALPEPVLKRLAIENDERLFTTGDCLAISGATGLPVVMDLFHHELNPGLLGMRDALDAAAATWRASDGRQLIDYSDQRPGGRRGAHAASIDAGNFTDTLAMLGPGPLDVMLEVKDKELSALEAMRILSGRRPVSATPACPRRPSPRSRREGCRGA